MWLGTLVPLPIYYDNTATDVTWLHNTPNFVRLVLCQGTLSSKAASGYWRARHDNLGVTFLCTAMQCKDYGSVMAAHARMAAATLALHSFVALLRSANGVDLLMSASKLAAAIKSTFLS